MSKPVPTLVRFPHCRCQWQGDEVVHVCVRWGRLKGTDESFRFRGRWEQDYKAAKNQGDFEAATRLVTECIKRAPKTMDAIVDAAMPFIEDGTPLLCVVPHPAFDDDDGGDDQASAREIPRNVIPSVYANYIAAMLGATVDSQIIERERVGRTKLKNFERFLWQPSFTGLVQSKAAYIIVDDVFTLGGTIAAMRSYLLQHGGTVALSTALAHRTGRAQRLALTRETWNELQGIYGSDLSSFWKEVVGHDAICLTESEGSVIIAFGKQQTRDGFGKSLLHRLRDCLAEAAGRGNQSSSS